MRNDWLYLESRRWMVETLQPPRVTYRGKEVKPTRIIEALEDGRGFFLYFDESAPLPLTTLQTQMYRQGWIYRGYDVRLWGKPEERKMLFVEKAGA